MIVFRHFFIRLFFGLCVSMLVFACSVVHKQSIDSSKAVSNQDMISIEDIIVASTDSYPVNTQLAIALVEGNETKFVGFVKTDDGDKFVDNRDKVFEIGSVSKVFTSIILSSLVMDGKISLHDYIQDHLNVKLADGQAITFQHLANHTSGLPRLPSNLNLFTTDPSNPYKDYDEGLLNKYLQSKISLEQAPGSVYAYSNLGAGLLGHTMGKLTNQSYESLLQERICSKYLMTNTTSNRKEVKTPLVKGVNHRGAEVSQWDFNVLVGAGGILSTVEDLGKFVIAQLENHEEMALAHRTTFTVSDKLSLGLGWHILQKEEGRQWLWHNGGTGGYTSSMTIEQESRTAVVVLSNVSAFHKDSGNIDKLCFDLLNSINNR